MKEVDLVYLKFLKGLKSLRTRVQEKKVQLK